MFQRLHYLGILFIALDNLAACETEPVEETSLASRISAVETNLKPAVSIAGRAARVYSIAERMAHYAVPGVSIAVIVDGKIDWARGYGIKETGSDAPITVDTLFQAASISKPVAAVAALQLVEDGTLDLDTDVNDMLTSWQVPDFAALSQEKVTLRRLLSHGAGLTVHGFPGYAADVKLPTLTQVLDGATPANTEAIHVDIPPGSEWRYSGGGYTVMQQLLIDVTGESFPAAMSTLVLEKLGMTSSTYAQPLPTSRRHAAATGHKSEGTTVAGDYHTYPEMAAAGLWTTPTDLARYAMAIQAAYAGDAEAPLSQAMIREMLRIQIGDWGLGLGLDPDGELASFSHGGANEGFRGLLFAYAANGKGAVVMTNADSGHDLTREIMRSIAHVYQWPDFQPETKTVIGIESERLDDYVGTYTLVAIPDIDIVVRRAAKQLLVMDTNSRREDGYFCEAVDTFFNEGGRIIEFARSDEGNVTSLTVNGALQAKRLP